MRLRRLALRLKALLLLATFVGSGLPTALDVALHHLRPGLAAPLPHLDPPGGCHSHAEHCLLRGHDSALRFAVTKVPLRLAAQRAERLGLLPGDDPRPRLLPFLHHSRAPPQPLV